MNKNIRKLQSSLIFRTIGKEYLVLKDTYTKNEMMDRLIGLAEEYEENIRTTQDRSKND